MDNRFTTVPNGHPAPLWYQPTDGSPRLYWTDEEWDYQQRIYRKGDNSADAIQEAIDTRNHQPVGIQIRPQMIDRPRTCGHCKNTFYSSWPQAKTCGNPVCATEYRKAAAREAYHRSPEKHRAAKRERDRKAKAV